MVQLLLLVDDANEEASRIVVPRIELHRACQLRALVICQTGIEERFAYSPAIILVNVRHALFVGLIELPVLAAYVPVRKPGSTMDSLVNVCAIRYFYRISEEPERLGDNRFILYNVQRASRVAQRSANAQQLQSTN